MKTRTNRKSKKKTTTRRKSYKKRKSSSGGMPPIKPSPLRKGYSATTGAIDKYIVEDLDEISTLEKCQRQYRVLKFGYDTIEKKNEYLRNDLEKLKRKHLKSNSIQP